VRGQPFINYRMRKMLMSDNATGQTDPA